VRPAELYDEEILPVYDGRFATLLLRSLDRARLPPPPRVLEIGCATGHLTRMLRDRLRAPSRIEALDEREPFLAEARRRLRDDGGEGAAVTLRLGGLHPLPVEDGAAELVVSNLAVAEDADPRAALKEVVRALAPGGQAILTSPLRGTWGEFLDLFRDVLREGGRPEAVAALERHVNALPDGEGLARRMEQAGLHDVELEIERWEILFKSAREFFFAPLVELGPLASWKQIAGRGEQMQDAFFFTKEAIDAYYKQRPFSVTVVGAAVRAGK
jgi:ubiquinone/menaquinone biosynthesis C-methylase UbiE